jgi:hypothetical protein
VKLLATIWSETFGLFVDDGALAALCIALIAIVTIATLWLSLPALIAGAALLAGCIAILTWSVLRAIRPR